MRVLSVAGVCFNLLTIVLFIAPEVDNLEYCPPTCDCDPSERSKLSSDKVKAKCSGGNHIHTSVEEIQFEQNNGAEITNLDLSGNNITYLLPKSFVLHNLLKLDISENHIERIEDGAFSGLAVLKRLDLSNNRIRFLTKGMFIGLPSLERLKLSQNLISQLKEGTFDNLESLKQLDISGNPLICDCELWWLSGWSVKLSPVPKCASPASLKGEPLRKLRPPAHSCPWPYEFPPLELSPQHDQVVFEGDSLRLDCRAGHSLPSVTLQESTITWYWTGLLPQAIFSSVHIENKQLSDSGFVESSIIIQELRTNHTGEWNCKLVSNEGNHSSTVTIIVISGETKFCPPTITRDNRGEYSWPKTVAGHEVKLPCKAAIGIGMAKYNCTINGEWKELNTSVCPYISETTRILQQYARMNLSAVRQNVFETAKRLYNYTMDNRAHLSDPMDIVYVTQTVHSYLDFVEREKDLGSLLLDMVSNTMELDSKLLSLAQKEDRSCSKLLSTVETVAQFTPSLQSHKPNMAVEEFRVSRESFLGLTCTWWNTPDRKPAERLFQCNTSNKSAVRVNDKIMEGSIQIPASLLHQLETSWGKPAGGTHQLMVAMYDNSKLFPTPFNSTVSSPVIGTKLVGLEGNFELSEPVTVMLGGGGGQGRLTPVWWDTDKTQWATGPCEPYRILSDLLVLHCRRLGYFTLLMEPPTFHRPEQALSRLSSPSVYIGTFIGSTCLLISAFTYAVCHSSIQMSTRLKHSLANTWIAISFLSIVFSVGMYQTKKLYLCRAIGLVVHYLTLCVLFWMAVTINGLHRAVRKPESAPIVTGSDDPESSGGGAVGQPTVGLYLVGWGVAALLVGLSGAVNPAGYAAPTYCSLGPGPAFMPVLVPVTALLVFILIRFLMVRSAAGEKDSNAQLSEGTQATDLELLETGGVGSGGGIVGGGTEQASVHSVGTPSSHIEDPEHSPSIQLKAFLIVHILYSFVWVSGALSVLTPLGLPYEETVFGTSYAVFMILLGSFVVFFYCFSRSDVRGVWFTLKPIVRSRNVTDSHAAPPPLISSRNSVTSASIGMKSIDPRPEPQGETIQKVNLVDLHRRQYHSNNSVITNGADSFYNPHQSVVARKFFKRQRRKQNSLGTRRCGDGATPVSPDNSELFHLGGGGAVVAVGGGVEGRERGCPLERLVIGAESDDLPPPIPVLPFNNDSSAKYYASVASECCSCVVSEVHSATDCTRDLTSEHSSRSSHLYATVAPDVSPTFAQCKPHRLIIDTKNEAVRLKMADPVGSGSLSPTVTNSQMSDEDKKETCV